jgi:hypothetical protein
MKPNMHQQMGKQFILHACTIARNELLFANLQKSNRKAWQILFGMNDTSGFAMLLV